jgi:outer membrane protein OmpA-like peptidoglycan-associated protein
MEFEIRDYPDGSDKVKVALSEERAKAVQDWLTYLGTAPWSLKAARSVIAPSPAPANRERPGRVEFIRIQ